jgi:rubrerythrin
MSMADILSLAIADEEDAREFYHRAASLAANPHTRRTLLELEAMERGHAEALREELSDLLVQRGLEAGLAD